MAKYDILTAQDMVVKFRTDMGLDFSPEAINTVAKWLGYKKHTFGGVRGYKKTVYTALTQNIEKLKRCEEDIKTRKSLPKLKKAKYTPQENYYMLNGEKDNKDYDFELDENKIRMAIMDSIKELNF